MQTIQTIQQLISKQHQIIFQCVKGINVNQNAGPKTVKKCKKNSSFFAKIYSAGTRMGKVNWLTISK